ncbi:hypothetical protein [Halovenus salina]|uniref:Uncharacterized protein n=1 Tax=Halovenus salina TaxID=1510225 RepID=A0ABD5W387_9EURY|nr:hypothetical protein [Halovenus salina]
MGTLTPVAFDIETSGLDRGAVITVAGFTDDLGSWMVLNTGGRNADQDHLLDELRQCVENPVGLRVVEDEAALLEAVDGYVDERLGEDEYLTAYNGETWNGGFDLPFLRSACHRNNVAWPFDDVAYADTMEAIQRFDTGDTGDLVGVYDRLIGDESCDPFDDSKRAVETWEHGDWLPLLKHNLADIERTRELTSLASEYVPKSDFSMKNLAPPQS